MDLQNKINYFFAEAESKSGPRRVGFFPDDLRQVIDMNNSELHRLKTYNLKNEFSKIESVIDDDSKYYHYPISAGKVSYTLKEAQERADGLEKLKMTLSPFVNRSSDQKFSSIYKRIELEINYLKREIREQHEEIPIFSLATYERVLQLALRTSRGTTPIEVIEPEFEAMLTNIRALFDSPHNHDIIEKIITTRKNALHSSWKQGKPLDQIANELSDEIRLHLPQPNNTKDEPIEKAIPRVFSKRILDVGEFNKIADTIANDNVKQKWIEDSKKIHEFWSTGKMNYEKYISGLIQLYKDLSRKDVTELAESVFNDSRRRKNRLKKMFNESFKRIKIKDKEYVCDLWDGTKIYLVNGEEVRDNGNVEYCLGGHYYEQIGDDPTPTDCPKNEVWIEKELNPKEQVFILVHELTEWLQMKYHGVKYEKAHDISNSIENAIRQMAKKTHMVSSS